MGEGVRASAPDSEHSRRTAREGQPCDPGSLGIKQRVFDFAGVSSEFVSSFRRILLAPSEGDAMRHTVGALMVALSPRTITLTSVDSCGEPVVMDNYRDGVPWEAHIGERVPTYALARTIVRTGSTVFWDTNSSRVKAPDWFIYLYFIGVPVKASDSPGACSSALVLSFDDEGRFCDSSAVIAGVVAAAYATVAENEGWIGRGIEIGRSIARERMVQRLHDTSVQDIFACECAVRELIESESRRDSGDTPDVASGVTSRLESVLGLLRQANRDLRGVLAEASLPAGSGSVDLGAQLSTIAGRHESLGGCKVTSFVQRELRVSPAVAEVATSIATEALANVRKHANAHNAVLSCSIHEEVLMLSVSDDGSGFDPDAGPSRSAAIERPSADRPPHFGLANMSRMARAIAGTFTVVSDAEEGGTTVRVRLPLAQGAMVGE